MFGKTEYSGVTKPHIDLDGVEAFSMARLSGHESLISWISRSRLTEQEEEVSR